MSIVHAAPSTRRRRRHPGRLERLLLALFQVLAVLVSLDIAAFAGSVAVECCTDDDAVEESACQECPAERNGRECPPACPDCHRAHGVVALPGVASSMRPLAAVSTLDPVTLRPTEASAPRAPPLFGIYRPPRTPFVSI